LLYNFHRIRDRALDLIVVEGFASTWWLHQCGYWNTVALMGSSCSDEQADLIAAIASKVWILSDGDDAGRLCAESVWHHLGTRLHCRHLKLEEGKQPTDLSKGELDRIFKFNSR
jgi:DNA primase